MERDAHGSGSTRGPDPRAGDGGQCPPELIAARGAPTTEPNDSGPEVLLDPGNHNLPFRMKQHRIRCGAAASPFFSHRLRCPELLISDYSQSIAS